METNSDENTLQTVYNDPSSLGLVIENYPDRLTVYAVKDGILKI